MSGKNDITGPQRRWILIALMFTLTLAAMDTTIVSTAIPEIVGDLGGFDILSWVFSIYILAQTVTIPVYGKFADLYGRKPVLLIGIVIFLVGSALSAFSWSMVSLILFRGLQGLGAGSIMATVNTLAADMYPVERRAKIQGVLSSVWGVSAILGPTLGGAFAQYGSWRWIFFINIPFGITAFLMLIVHLKEHILKTEHKIDFAGALLILVSGTLIITVLQTGQSWGWTSVKSVLFIIGSVISLGLTIIVEKKSSEPIMPLWVWSRRTLLGTNLGTMALGIIMMGPGMYLPIYGQSILGLGAIAAGLTLATSSITWTGASILSQGFVSKLDYRNTSMLGMFIMLIGSAGFLFIPEKASAWWLVLDQSVIGFGCGLFATPALVGVQSTVKWAQRGVVTGSNMFARNLGQSLGAALLGGVLNSALGNWLKKAPADVSGNLPGVNDVTRFLQENHLAGAAKDYLQRGFSFSTQQVYIAMAVVAVVAVFCLLITPRHFKVVEDD